MNLEVNIIMNYHKIAYDDQLNGEGLRVTLFVSGCSPHCDGCHNPQTWNSKSGKIFNEEAKQDFEHWKDSYEKYFNAIETILSKEKILKLDEYKEYSNNKYKHELDGLDFPRLSLMCNVLKAYGFLDDKDNNGCFEFQRC